MDGIVDSDESVAQVIKHGPNRVPRVWKRRREEKRKAPRRELVVFRSFRLIVRNDKLVICYKVTQS